MLYFSITKADQRFERYLVAQQVILANFQHLGVNEALGETEYVCVGPALDLADEPLLIIGQSSELRQ